MVRVSCSCVDWTPFFSPDGEWIGFLVANRVMKVAVQGGPAVAVGEFPNSRAGASWGDDGNIVLGSLTGLWRMPAKGGAAEPIYPNNKAARAFPDVLPGSQAVLFNGLASGGTPIDLDALEISAAVLATGETKTLIRGGYWPRYVNTPGRYGHLLYVSRATLFGVAFDPERLELRGKPVPLLGDLAAGTSINSGGGQFAFSNTGALVYLSGKSEDISYPMLWLDPAGATTPLIAQAAQFSAPRLSPDGNRLAYGSGAGTRAMIYGSTICSARRRRSSHSAVSECARSPGHQTRGISSMETERPSGGSPPTARGSRSVSSRRWPIHAPAHSLRTDDWCFLMRGQLVYPMSGRYLSI